MGIQIGQLCQELMKVHNTYVIECRLIISMINFFVNCRMIIDKDTIRQVFNENLKTSKVYAKIVPKILTFDQKEF